MQPSPPLPLSPIRVARNMYREALASMVADIVPRLMESVTAAITEQAANGDMYTKLFTRDEFILEHRPTGLEALLGEYIAEGLVNDDCVPSSITVLISPTPTPKTYVISVRGAVALCKTNDRGVPVGVDLIKEVKALVESRKRRRRVEDAPEEEPAAKKARTDDAS